MFDQFYLINRTLNIGLVSTMMNIDVRMLQTFPLRSETMPKSPEKGGTIWSKYQFLYQWIPGCHKVFLASSYYQTIILQIKIFEVNITLPDKDKNLNSSKLPIDFMLRSEFQVIESFNFKLRISKL